MLAGLLGVGALLLVIGVILGWAASRSRTDDAQIVEAILQRLPQTQCAQCGFPGCRPYAEAIAAGEAAINQCPPGGQQTIRDLAELLDQPETTLNPQFGEEKPLEVAVIDEARCIGCVLCIKACPVDAIVGAPHKMHTVIADECTGCELCVAPCPVDCIQMQTARPLLTLYPQPKRTSHP